VSIEEFNRLVEQAYEAAFSFEVQLIEVYERAYARQGDLAIHLFEQETGMAAARIAERASLRLKADAWTPPVIQTLTNGMSEQEVDEANRVRDEAAAAIMAVFLTLGITGFAIDFMESISLRAQVNFEQELLRNLRKIVADSFAAGKTAEETAVAIRETFTNVTRVSSEMLAQTELTALVNERSVVAAQKAFPDGVSKTWLSVGDNRVRAAHAAAVGQTVPIDQPFSVGGASLMYPGDPTGPLRLVARCRCRLSYTDEPTTITAAARPDVSELAMIAVYPTPDEQDAISTSGGNPAETMHCTMVFLGEVANIDLAAAGRAVARVARNTEAMSGKVGGVGMFAEGPDGFPSLAIPNVSGLSMLRVRLVDALAAEGVDLPSEHDWVPHMTIAYQADASLPDLAVIGSPLTFDSVSLVVADERTDYTLGTLVASAQEDTLMSMIQNDTAPQETSYLRLGDSLQPIPYNTATNTNFATITISTDTTNEDARMGVADGAPWRALLAVEGVVTEDGRMLAEGSLTWRDLPLSLMALDFTGPGGHEGARVAGRIDNIWRDGSEVWGEGVFNTDEFGAHIEELVANQSLRGNSIDPAVLAYEYRHRETGMVVEGDDLMEAMMNDHPLVTVFLEAIIMASTVCSTPAIGEATIMLASGVMRTVWFEEQNREVMTASAAGMVPLHPPSSWFADPRLKEPTALTITPEGKVFGHAALWNSCHIGEPSGPGVCVPPPRSGMNYEIFHHGACQTEEGHDVVVGQLTLGTLHAGSDLGWKATMEHYEHSGLAFADVHAYEDRFGIVVAGALRPDVPAEKVREAKAGALSGDWRQVIGRGLEFLAALVVNVPGFPIPRPSAHIVASASGEEEIVSLVAAGMVEPCDCEEQMSDREFLRKIRALT